VIAWFFFGVGLVAGGWAVGNAALMIAGAFVVLLCLWAHEVPIWHRQSHASELLWERGRRLKGRRQVTPASPRGVGYARQDFNENAPAAQPRPGAGPRR
jgi:hypothetical protein